MLIYFELPTMSRTVAHPLGLNLIYWINEWMVHWAGELLPLRQEGMKKAGILRPEDRC